MTKKRRSRQISIVRLLREQQREYELMLQLARREMQEIRELHARILTRLESFEIKYPDLADIAEDLRYLHGFCAQFWSRDGAQPLPENGEMPLPKSATDIVPNVPFEKRSKFWNFVEKLRELLGKDTRD